MNAKVPDREMKKNSHLPERLGEKFNFTRLRRKKTTSPGTEKNKNKPSNEGITKKALYLFIYYVETHVTERPPPLSLLKVYGENVEIRMIINEFPVL